MPSRKRIESTTSRTAEWTCVSRAASSLENNPYYRSDDHIARLLLPDWLKLLIHFKLFRAFFTKILAPKGIYEYVIARTKYIDAAFKQALLEQFDQILLFGAGFDTRALRFQAAADRTRKFELDVPLTQQAKIRQYQKRGLTIPPNVVFIAIDFDREILPAKLNESGFYKQKRSLFIMEGLLMYLQPQSVHAIFQTIQEYAGEGSRVVFDYVHASVLRNEFESLDESKIARKVFKAEEQWHFGMEKEEIKSFLPAYGLRLIDHRDARDLERTYFSDSEGNIVGSVNAAHCLATAELWSTT
jgi:methyltransferase (TIGR00027 family)